MKQGTGSSAWQPAEANDDERRNVLDRRSGRDRRHTAERTPPSNEPRPFGFRDFEPRRANQDRRLYGIDGGWHPGTDPVTAADPAEDPHEDPLEGVLALTADQLRALLRKDGR